MSALARAPSTAVYEWYNAAVSGTAVPARCVHTPAYDTNRTTKPYQVRNWLIGLGLELGVVLGMAKSVSYTVLTLNHTW